jgi:uncharacterized protein YlxP (DUF503 family)
MIETGHHERIGSQFFDRVRINFMSFRNEQSTDFLDRLRTQPTHIVTNRSPLEFGVLVPRSQSHDGSQLDVILGQIMNLIVRVVAPEPNSGQYQNVSVVHAFAATLRRCFSIDVAADQLHDLFSDVGFGVHMLKRSQHRYDRVSAFKIEFDPMDWWTV